MSLLKHRSSNVIQTVSTPEPPAVVGSPGAPRRPGRRRTVLGLDVGTTKVCAIIGDVEADGTITVLGIGSSPSRGVRGGMVIDIHRTVEGIQTAYAAAYGLARVAPQELYIGIAGDHITGLNTSGMIDASHPSAGINERDRRTVIRKALQVALPPDVEIIEHIVREYVIDGRGGITNPIGICGSRLEAKLHVITAASAAVNNFLRCVKKAGHKTSGIVLQSIASAMAILTPRELELGVAIVDIGGGTCDIAIFCDGTLQFTGEIGRGGDMITQDIAMMLRCSPHDAENLKKRFGHADPADIDINEIIELPHPLKGGHHVKHNRRELAEIIEARVEDLFFGVREVLQRSGFEKGIGAGIVVTGGSALLEGVSGVAERILNHPSRVGMPQGLRGLGEVVSSPIYSTGVGLIKWAAEEGPGFQRENWLIRKIKEVIDIYV